MARKRRKSIGETNVVGASDKAVVRHKCAISPAIPMVITQMKFVLLNPAKSNSKPAKIIPKTSCIAVITNKIESVFCSWVSHL